MAQRALIQQGASSSTETSGSDAATRKAVDLYVDQRLSTYRIAEQLGIDRQRVTRMLHRAGVSLPPRGKDRPRPWRGVDHPSEETLRRLYVEQRLSSTAIARLLGVSDRLIREDLARAGIDRRHRGAWDRSDRADVDPTSLEELYLKKELPADEVGRQIGLSLQIVLRSAHSHGIAVRVGGTPCPSHAEVPLLDALYNDPDVRRVLRRHKVPIVKTTGPLSQRFPSPTPLTQELVSDLYEKCGLSSFQIELVTGQSSIMVLRRLAECSINRRPRGGLSPFLRQQRETSGLRKARRP